MENDHHVLAQRLRDFCLPNPQALASRDHQNDGDDPPRDPEHRQKCSQLVRPKCAEHIANEVAENHSAFLDGTAIRRSSSGAQMDRDARLAIGTHSGGELLQKSSWQSRPQFPEWLSRLTVSQTSPVLRQRCPQLASGKACKPRRKSEGDPWSEGANPVRDNAPAFLCASGSLW